MSMDESCYSELTLAGAMEKCTSINDMVMINGNQLSQLMVACYLGNPDYVQDLLEVPGIEIDLQNDEGHHALACACAHGHTEVAHLIITACSNSLDLQCMQGMTPLMYARQNGHKETVLLMLLNGASVNKKRKDGLSSLMLYSK